MKNIFTIKDINTDNYHSVIQDEIIDLKKK